MLQSSNKYLEVARNSNQIRQATWINQHIKFRQRYSIYVWSISSIFSSRNLNFFFLAPFNSQKSINIQNESFCNIFVIILAYMVNNHFVFFFYKYNRISIYYFYSIIITFLLLNEDIN